MAKNRNNKEAEKNKKKDSGLLKKAVGVAAIAGVGYAGFKNRGNISNFIKCLSRKKLFYQKHN